MTAIADIVMTFMNSARKKIANRMPVYSVLKPPTSSCSASTRSNGGWFVSAVAAMRKIAERHERAQPEPVASRTSRAFDPRLLRRRSRASRACRAWMSTPRIASPNAASYESSCAVARTEPSSGYFEPDDQPASITPYTPRPDIARMKLSRPAFGAGRRGVRGLRGSAASGRRRSCARCFCVSLRAPGSKNPLDIAGARPRGGPRGRALSARRPRPRSDLHDVGRRPARRLVRARRVKGSIASTGVVGVWAGPRTPGTAYNLLHHALGELDGMPGVWGQVIGGMEAISQAIARSAESAGATVRIGRGRLDRHRDGRPSASRSRTARRSGPPSSPPVLIRRRRSSTSLVPSSSRRRSPRTCSATGLVAGR